MLNRRKLIKSTAIASSGGLVTLAGCSGSSQDANGLSVEDTDTRSTTFGNIVVAVLVENITDDTKSARLHAEVDVDGGNLYEESDDISVTSGGREKFQLKFDISAEESMNAEQYEYRAWLEAK